MPTIRPTDTLVYTCWLCKLVFNSLHSAEIAALSSLSNPHKKFRNELTKLSGNEFHVFRGNDSGTLPNVLQICQPEGELSVAPQRDRVTRISFRVNPRLKLTVLNPLPHKSSGCFCDVATS